MVFDRLKYLDDYSYRNGQFYFREQPLPTAERYELLERRIAALDPHNSQAIGPRTLARALVTAAAQGSEGQPSGLLRGATSPSHKALRYSLGDAESGASEKPSSSKLQPLGPGARPIMEAPKLLGNHPSPFSGSEAKTPR